MVGVGLGLTGLLLGLRPRLAAWPLALTAVAALLYRDPDRVTPDTPGAIFAPAGIYARSIAFPSKPIRNCGSTIRTR